MKGYQPEGSNEKNGQGTANIFTLPFLEKARERGTILEAPALLCNNEMNLHVALGSYIGIIPRSEAVYLPGGNDVKDIAILTRVGKNVCFCVKEILHQGENPPYILLSRRKAQAECFKNYISTLSPGDVVAAKVTHLEAFGAFLDIGCGTTALLPVDAISVSRISHPRLRFSVGDEFSVVIKSIDADGRIYATRKELLGTWEENASLFCAGQTVAGTVRSIEPYGIFVELTENLTGLAEYKEGIKENETAAVYIKSILPERMKIKLIIIDSHSASLTAGKNTRQMRELPKHIERWQYSPKGATKTIVTEFT